MLTRFVGVLLAVAALGALLAAPARADHLFSPSDQEISAWLTDGIEAAGQNANLMALPGVRRWIWTNEPAGLPMQSGRIIRFLVIATPQLVATLEGWQAAWDEETWAKLNADESYESTMKHLVQKVRGNLSKGSLVICVGSTRSPVMEGKGFSATLSGIVFGNGSWYDLHFDPALSIGTYARAEATDRPKGEWAARYAVAGIVTKGLVYNASGIEISQGTMSTGQRSSNKKWIQSVNVPMGITARDALFVLGNPGTFVTIGMNVGP